jgi:seryl-tRNA synthetase
MQKRKALDDETAELKKKKQKLETDMEALLASADDFAEKAEKNHQLTLIAKSNAMRKAAKEKAAEIKEVEQQLNTKLLELSNC